MGNSKTTFIVRWLLIAPSMILAWWLTLWFFIFLVVFLEQLCPESQMISGLCVASWYSAAITTMTILGAMISAVIVICAARWMAPIWKKGVTWAALGAGTLVAITSGAMTGAWVTAFSAIVSGAVAATYLNNRIDHSTDRRLD